LSDTRITATYTDEVVCADLSLYIVGLENREDENQKCYLNGVSVFRGLANTSKRSQVVPGGQQV